MRQLLLALCAFLALAASGQKKAADPKTYGATITAADLKKHLYIVASKEMEGRETATEGQRKAAAYIENQFRTLGLQPGNNGSYQAEFPVVQDSLVSAELIVNGQAWQLNQDFAANIGGNHSASFSASEIMYVGNGRVDSANNAYKDQNVLGKMVLVSSTSPNVNALIEAAQKNGAAALLVVQANFPRKPLTRGNQSIQEFKRTNFLNTFFVSEKVAEAIMKTDWPTAKAGTAAAKLYMANISLGYNETSTRTFSSNVLGYMEGTDKKDEIVFITAHYDHLGKRDTVIYYGADDDGSGTCAVLELAEAFSKAKAAGKGPRRSIVFMTVSGEEKGLWGSQYYSDHPIYPLEKTSVDLNIDMIGRIDPTRKQGDSMNYVYVVGDDKLSTDLRPISESVNKKYSKLELDYKFNDPNDRQRIYFRSDHYNFARKGVPIIFYFNGTHADYHRPTDTPDKINYDLYAKRAQFVFYTAWEMANREDMLKRDLKLEVPAR